MWTDFLTRWRIVAMASASLVTIVLGLLFAAGVRPGTCSEGDVEVACPEPMAVADQFYFMYQPLGENGSITARVSSMEGTITYPPPDHDEIVSGLVPWAKAGIIVKDGLKQGSTYVAMMVTGSHGTRMQYDYTHDVAAEGGGQWLRLTRSGDSITGYSSNDGLNWTEVGAARLEGLPATALVGLFATSPGDLTLRRVALGGSLSEVRFTQASAVFEDVAVQGATGSGWSHGSVGEMGRTDWEKYHRAPGVVESEGTFTVTGSGDIGPMGTDHGVHALESALIGLPISLIIVIFVAARFARGPDLRKRAAVVGTVTFAAGMLAAAIVVPAGPTDGVPLTTQLSLIFGAAGLLAVAAVLALALAALVRRAWLAATLGTCLVVLPYLLAALPLLPDDLAKWLLRLTPAAAFSFKQTLDEYPQVVAHYAPSTGYFPLPWWAGFAVLCAYTAVALGLALQRQSLKK